MPGNSGNSPSSAPNRLRNPLPKELRHLWPREGAPMVEEHLRQKINLGLLYLLTEEEMGWALQNPREFNLSQGQWEILDQLDSLANEAELASKSGSSPPGKTS